MNGSNSAAQEEAVKRVMKLKAEDYYGILLLEKTCTTVEVKKAYKKQALLMHPDKNKTKDADEAFRRASKACEVLSDEDKRKIFDQTGTDPDSRAAMGGGPGGFGNARSPFGPHFARASPDDIFSQFFGAPNRGGGPQFQFQFGGDPNDIFSQLFGDALFGNPRRGRQFQRAQAQQPAEADTNSSFSKWLNLGIIGAVLVLPTILSWLFNSSGSSLPRFTFESTPPYTQQMFTPTYDIPFYVNPKDMDSYSPTKQKTLAKTAENRFISVTRSACNQEYLYQQQLMQDAVGWLFTDQEKYEEAKNMPLPHCQLLRDMGLRMRGPFD